ncbi:MAG: hypothetical protein A3G34_05435 [Candidatus Lindowbacteria bacterium RIFCSPLOWO2_12_FULL_62_27]|nr:MAG: hypothetical protein A3G34_05435 [Candidatus Lindowbacteria bacterium RIFCSPLOWO2_12_FULL_62_27]OGH63754.1 MAG: hypothetical protein A3I06_10670 [Candidatus Lindowbacteria bacterium RIFCSPLOWO2_02_FULL_62_12]
MSKSVNVLVVDDDRAVCDVIRRTLEASFKPVSVKVVYDGVSAVESLDESLDLIVLDLGLPQLRGEGVSLANELKGANAPILIITGEPNPDLEFMGDINVMGILKKPFDLNDLVKASKTILSGREYSGN